MMIFRKIFGIAVCGFVLFALPAMTYAATISYSFTYTNVADQYPTVTSTGTGSGSFSITYTALGAQPMGALSAFSFADTITETDPTASSSSFTYTLSNVSSSAIVLGGTLANPVLADLSISTKAVAGSNSTVGTDSFTLFFAAANPGAGSTQTAGVDLGYDTAGDITVSGPNAPTSTPEPSALPIVGLLFGAGALVSRRRRLPLS